MQYFFIIIDKNLFINVFKHIFFDYSEKKKQISSYKIFRNL